MKAKEPLLFTITTIAAICLFIASFFVPPMGIIDASVLKAGAILLAFGSVAQVPELARRGTDLKLQHGQTSLSVNNPDIDRENENNED